MIAPPRTPEEIRAHLEAVQGIWKDRLGGKTADEWMKEICADD